MYLRALAAPRDIRKAALLKRLRFANRFKGVP